MSSSSSAWVHCFFCKKSVQELKCAIYLTACGNTVCDSCRSKLKECPSSSCRGVCRTMAVNNKAPANVLNMVKDISGQLKSVFKTLNWQENQKRALVHYREEVLQKMEKHNARLDENLAGVEEELQVRKAHLKKMEDREALLKAELNKLTRGNGGDGRGERNYQSRMGGATGGGNMSSAFYKGMAEHSPANSFLGERLDSSRRSVGSNGSKGSKRSKEDQSSYLVGRPSEFLQMKTPAAWYKSGPLRRPSPQ